LRFRIAPRWRAAAKPRADRVRVETVDAREIRPASSERAVRAWIDTRRASLLECYRAHAAAAACADSMTVTYDCVVTPDGAAEHCAAVDFIFDIRRPECGFGVEGSLCVARALDGSKGPLPFGADSIAVTLHPR
ncbi:MAG: hypothetical protein KF782_26970, partial [Labilithrix sp.]|nr:hypothetical protein [Labilithrix sp.]